MEVVSGNASIPCMEGGSGEDSYANNCRPQNFIFHTYAKPQLAQALDHLLHHFFPPWIQQCVSEHHPQELHASASTHRVHLNVADFGCSYGPNTLDYAAFIVQGLYNRLKSKLMPCSKPNGDVIQSFCTLDLEMQYFFSDLPSNNFNSIFQSLEPFLQQQLQCFDQLTPLRFKLFHGAVARSFHDRLFPTGTLHLAISTHTLHWLSQGLISKEERDMFNIPFYNCHKTEMQEALQDFSNEFKVVKMEVMRDCSNLPKEEEQKIQKDHQAFGKFVATFVASLMKPMVQKYLNESRANDLFQRLQNQAAKKACLSTPITNDMLLAIIQRL